MEGKKEGRKVGMAERKKGGRSGKNWDEGKEGRDE